MLSLGVLKPHAMVGAKAARRHSANNHSLSSVHEIQIIISQDLHSPQETERLGHHGPRLVLSSG